jgi:hypothetical protein
MDQKQGTGYIETPIMIFDPSMKDSVEEITTNIELAIEDMGTYSGRTIRNAIFKFVDSCMEVSGLPENKIYLDERISFEVKPVYQMEPGDDISVLKSFKDFIEK